MSETFILFLFLSPLILVFLAISAVTAAMIAIESPDVYLSSRDERSHSSGSLLHSNQQMYRSEGPGVSSSGSSSSRGPLVDVDGNGAIEYEEFRKFYPDLPDSEAKRIFEEVDTNHDGILDRAEFSTWVEMKRKAFKFARVMILPKNARKQKEYSEEYSCIPPPIFMFFITAIEITIFFYHTSQLIVKEGYVGKYGPAPVTSRLIYNPHKRHEVWRYLTYMFVHSGYMHITNNVIMQLVLGILLEMVHKGWRVLVIYFAGVLAGSLATSVVNPHVYLAGASGGVYALIFAHLSTVILNWKEMTYPWIRVLLFSAYATFDIGMALYYNYHLGIDTTVGYPAHLGGGIAGLLIGIYILKNLKWEPWENYLWYASVVIGTGLVIFAVAWNVFKKDYYFENV